MVSWHFSHRSFLIIASVENTQDYRKVSSLGLYEMITVSIFYALIRSLTQAVRFGENWECQGSFFWLLLGHSWGQAYSAMSTLMTTSGSLQNTYLLLCITRLLPGAPGQPTLLSVTQWQQWTGSAPPAVWNKGQLCHYSEIIFIVANWESGLCRFWLMSHQSGPECHSQMLLWWLDLAGGHSKLMTLAAFPICPGNWKLLFERKVTTVL